MFLNFLKIIFNISDAWKCSIPPTEKPEFHPHEKFCYKFYECANGHPYEFTCPRGQNWRQDELRCDLGDKQCGTLTTLGIPSTTPAGLADN